MELENFRNCGSRYLIKNIKDVIQGWILYVTADKHIIVSINYHPVTRCTYNACIT